MNINCLVLQCIYIYHFYFFLIQTCTNHLIQTCASGPVRKESPRTSPKGIPNQPRTGGNQGAIAAVAFLTITPWSKSPVFWLCIGPRGSKKKQTRRRWQEFQTNDVWGNKENNETNAPQDFGIFCDEHIMYPDWCTCWVLAVLVLIDLVFEVLAEHSHGFWAAKWRICIVFRDGCGSHILY